MKRVDHLGKEFESLKEMLKFWGITYETYYNRSNNPKIWDSLEKILTTEIRNSAIKSTDHKGMEFESFGSMCEHWNVSANTVWRKLKEGQTLKEILEYKPIKSIIDNNDKRYATINEMLQNLNISEYIFAAHTSIPKIRYSVRWNEEANFSKAIQEILNIDNKNKGYRNCKKYREVLKVLNILDDKEEDINYVTPTEPLECYGIKFDTVISFAKYLKVNLTTLEFRLRTKREALEKIHDTYTCNIEIEGEMFTRATDIAKYFNIRLNSLTSRRTLGISWEQIIKEELEIKETLRITGLRRKDIAAYIRYHKNHDKIRKDYKL